MFYLHVYAFKYLNYSQEHLYLLVPILSFIDTLGDEADRYKLW